MAQYRSRPPHIITVGTFDLLHKGHRELIDWCLELSTVVEIAINHDTFVRQYKSVVPSTQFERKDALETVYGDKVILSWNPQFKPGDSIRPLLSPPGAKLLVVGDDWYTRGDYLKQVGLTWNDLHETNTMLVFKPRGPNPTHSSHLREGCNGSS